MEKQKTPIELVAKTGWKIHPVRAKSKIPALTDWPNLASNDPAQIESWIHNYPDGNWGIATGQASQILVVDIDPRNGGNASFRKLETEHGPFPKTIQANTGGGGEHLYFRLPKTEIKWPKSIATGIDIKADGGQVIAPGSTHPDGGKYEWIEGCSPWEIELAEAPEWLVELVQNIRNTSPAPVLERIPEGQRDDVLFAEATKLANMGWCKEDIYEALSARNRTACDPPLPDADIHRLAQQGPKYTATAQEQPGTSDADNARRLVHRHGKTIRYVNQDRGGAWYVYDGTRWDSNPSAETLVLQKAEETARAIANEAALEPDQRQAKILLEHAARSLNRGRFVAMVDQTKHQKEIAAVPDEFNQGDYLINLQNGTYDLVKHVLQKHRPEDMITKSTGYPYSPTARAPRWEKFLEEIFNGDKELIHWVQCLMGMSLTGYTGHQFVVFMTGRGSNGKSVLLETMTKVMGDYASKCNNVLFKTTRNDNEKGYILAGLRDVRFSYASELNEGEFLAAATIKEITGGETVSARAMYLGYSDLIPKMKLCMATNSLPRIDELNDGTWRRIRVVPFEVQFKVKSEADLGDMVRDDGLKDHLVKNELAGILNWCVEGLMWLQANDMQLPVCARIREATQAYKQDEDLLGDWIDEETLEKESYSATPMELLNSFRDYIGYKNFGTKKFKSLMESKGYRSEKSGGKRLYKGLKPKERKKEDPTFREQEVLSHQFDDLMEEID